MRVLPNNSPYRNAFELLVTEEVERQLQRLPSHLVEYINPIQVLAYALNRLPALYATSEEGRLRQEQRARTEFGPQITVAVRQAIAAVQQDPLKVFTPLKQRGNLDDYNRANRKPRGRLENYNRTKL